MLLKVIVSPGILLLAFLFGDGLSDLHWMGLGGYVLVDSLVSRSPAIIWVDIDRRSRIINHRDIGDWLLFHL
jgi:hypothetical protein